VEAPQLLLHSYPLDPDVDYRFVITASPALWKAMPPAEAVRFVDRYSQLQYRGISAADALTLEAQQRAQHAAQEAWAAGAGHQVRHAVASLA
jgi:hypothetical protein